MRKIKVSIMVIVFVLISTIVLAGTKNVLTGVGDVDFGMNEHQVQDSEMGKQTRTEFEYDSLVPNKYGGQWIKGELSSITYNFDDSSEKEIEDNFISKIKDRFTTGYKPSKNMLKWYKNKTINAKTGKYLVPLIVYGYCNNQIILLYSREGKNKVSKSVIFMTKKKSDELIMKHINLVESRMKDPKWIKDYVKK